MLVGQEENAPIASEGPLKRCAGIGRSADQASVLAAKGLDGGGGVHVGERDGVGGHAEAIERLPTGFNLGDLGHIGHGAAGIQIGQDHLLAIAAQHIGALGHEVHAAEDDVLCIGVGGNAGELVAVAGEVGEADHFVSLVVMAEQNCGGAEFGARLRDALVH